MNPAGGFDENGDWTGRCEKCGTNHGGYPPGTLGAERRCLRKQLLDLGAVGQVDQFDAWTRDTLGTAFVQDGPETTHMNPADPIQRAVAEYRAAHPEDDDLPDDRIGNLLVVRQRAFGLALGDFGKALLAEGERLWAHPWKRYVLAAWLLTGVWLIYSYGNDAFG